MSGYQLLDSGNFQKLEKIENVTIIRPALSAFWNRRLPQHVWQTASARYERFSGGDGKWHTTSKDLMENGWVVSIGKLQVKCRLTDFGHIGLFPEHHNDQDLKTPQTEGLKILNLFAYTGVTTLLCAQKGYHVTHVDASKTSIQWAKENARLSDLEDKPIRWIHDDVMQFVRREQRRGQRYHGIILDPPSYGRGPKGQIWKIEKDLPELMDILQQIHDKQGFLWLSSHSQGMTPLALQNIIADFYPQHVGCREMTIEEKSSHRQLPSGALSYYRGPGN